MKINKLTITKEVGRFNINYESVDDVLENLQQIKDEAKTFDFLNLEIQYREDYGGDYVVVASRWETDQEFKKRSKELTEQSIKAKATELDRKYAEFLKLKAEFEPEK